MRYFKKENREAGNEETVAEEESREIVTGDEEETDGNDDYDKIINKYRNRE